MLETVTQSKTLADRSRVVVHQNFGSRRSRVDGGLVDAVVGKYEYFDVGAGRVAKTRDTPADQLFGPYKDDEIAPYAMKTGLGVTPKYDAYLKSSRMCGSCHTIDLPVVDSPIPGRIAM